MREGSCVLKDLPLAVTFQAVRKKESMTLYIVSAPSGAGKTSLVRALVEKTDNLIISISYTTRQKRPSETDGVNYHFVSVEKFQTMIEQNEFLEYAKVFGYLYGTSKAWISTQLEKNKDVVLEIDWQGAQQIKKIFPDSVSIFVVPPSLETLETRLKSRGQDSSEVIQQRMKQASAECRHLVDFHYLVINDDFETAVRDLRTIVNSHRLKLSVQQKKYPKLIENLISL